MTDQEDEALAWGMDWTDPCNPNPLIALASCGALAVGGVFFLLGLGLWMLVDGVRKRR